MAVTRLSPSKSASELAAERRKAEDAAHSKASASLNPAATASGWSKLPLRFAFIYTCRGSELPDSAGEETRAAASKNGRLALLFAVPETFRVPSALIVGRRRVRAA